MAEIKKYQLTKDGLSKIENELEQLKTVERAKNLEALKEARAQGDLSENADYEAARDEQARIESRIKEIEDILKDYELSEESASSKDKVTLGTKVTIQFVGTGDEEEDYIIVGPLEADPLNGKISNRSPVGKAIMNRKAGDIVKFITETNEELEVEVKKIH